MENKKFSVEKAPSGGFVVTINGKVCDNAKQGMRQIAEAIGMEYDDSWTTQQFGTKLKKALDSGAPAGGEKQSRLGTDKELEKRVEASAAELAGARIRVYGKAQSRISLGIVHAYMVMYPQAKLEDIRKAFPNSLNPNKGVEELFMDPAFAKSLPAGLAFYEDDEVLTMGDGKKVAFARMWTKEGFESIAIWAKQYGIVIADYEGTSKGGEKGGFRMEYLNGYVPPKAKKGVPFWVWIIIAAIILALLGFLLFGKKGETKVVEKVVTETVVVHDTLYVKEIEEIEKNFNAAEFIVGKADLGDEAKFVLHDLAKVMQKNPQLRLRLEGHTSAEGEAAFNQKLSEARAQAAVTFLVEHEGIDASRLEAVGYGSSKLKNAADPMAPENRRTEFIVLE